MCLTPLHAHYDRCRHLLAADWSAGVAIRPKLCLEPLGAGWGQGIYIMVSVHPTVVNTWNNEYSIKQWFIHRRYILAVHLFTFLLIFCLLPFAQILRHLVSLKEPKGIFRLSYCCKNCLRKLLKHLYKRAVLRKIEIVEQLREIVSVSRNFQIFAITKTYHSCYRLKKASPEFTYKSQSPQSLSISSLVGLGLSPRGWGKWPPRWTGTRWRRSPFSLSTR
jgi:hypothetical protein